jgi:hypothetical protein
MKKTRELAPTKVSPSFLTAYMEDDKSTDSLRQYRVLPRLKVIQGQTKSELRDLAGLGAVLLSPGNGVVTSADEAFSFVPLYQYTEFIQWRDVRDKSGDAIVERSMNPHSDIAKQCRDEDLREQEYDGGTKKDPWVFRFTEHINFVGVIYGDHELAGTPCGMSFSRGEFMQGRSFCSAIMMRKYQGKQVPLWSTVWRMSVSERHRNGYDWFGFDFINPENPYILPEEADGMLELHLQFKELFESGLAGLDLDNDIEIDEDEDEDDEGDM